jgi:hypothetical protein
VGVGYSVYRGRGRGRGAIATKKAKKLQSIAEISTPPQCKNMGFPRGSVTPYHTITHHLLLSDKILYLCNSLKQKT